MKRHLTLKTLYDQIQFDANSLALEVKVLNVEVIPLVCELALLLYGRSEQLSLLFQNNKKVVISISGAGSKETLNNSGF